MEMEKSPKWHGSKHNARIKMASWDIPPFQTNPRKVTNPNVGPGSLWFVKALRKPLLMANPGFQQPQRIRCNFSDLGHCSDPSVLQRVVRCGCAAGSPSLGASPKKHHWGFMDVHRSKDGASHGGSPSGAFLNWVLAQMIQDQTILVLNILNPMILGIPQFRTPQATMGFNTKSWSLMLDDLGFQPVQETSILIRRPQVSNGQKNPRNNLQRCSTKDGSQCKVWQCSTLCMDTHFGTRAIVELNRQ